jgi:hypothetical protein
MIRLHRIRFLIIRDMASGQPRVLSRAERLREFGIDCVDVLLFSGW